MASTNASPPPEKPASPSCSSSSSQSSVERKSSQPPAAPGQLNHHAKLPSALSLNLRVSQRAKETKPRTLSVFAGTWNLHAKPAPKNLGEFIPPGRHDLYVIGTEECDHSIEMSFLLRSKERWAAQLTQLLGPDYVVIGQESLVAIHIIGFVRKELYFLVDEVEVASLATGIGDVLGNKGGVGLSMVIGSTSVVFINCHFAAHQGKVAQRNSDFHKINQRIPLRLPANYDIDDPENKCTDRFDHVIWMGDLNYRVNGTRAMIDKLLQLDMLEVMRANDQLGIERAKGRVFAGFNEGPLSFMPTYKLDAGTDTYDSSVKQRIPSWTDRILYKCNCDSKSKKNKAEQPLRLVKYDSVNSIKTSDHRPVYAVFEMVTQPPQAGSEPVGDHTSSKVCVIQ